MVRHSLCHKYHVQVYMGNLAQDVSSDVVEAVMDKFKSMDRVIMKQGAFCAQI